MAAFISRPFGAISGHAFLTWMGAKRTFAWRASTSAVQICYNRTADEPAILLFGSDAGSWFAMRAVIYARYSRNFRAMLRSMIRCGFAPGSSNGRAGRC
jgi:hypothetical protein